MACQNGLLSSIFSISPSTSRLTTKRKSFTCLALPCHALPCPALFRPDVLCLALSCPALPCPAVIDEATCEQRLWDQRTAGERDFYLCEVRGRKGGGEGEGGVEGRRGEEGRERWMDGWKEGGREIQRVVCSSRVLGAHVS